MPSPNIVKEYACNGIYHVYNKAQPEFTLFKKDEDCLKFLSLLSRYLVKPPFSAKLRYKTYWDKIDCFCFSLMDNHYHFELQQKGDNDKTIAAFMQSLIISYTIYYNKKYCHAGPVFQSSYKARRIKNNLDFINISRYIHLNPNPDNPEEAIKYIYSSARCYTKSEKSYDFVKTGPILELFNNSPEQYERFLLGK